MDFSKLILIFLSLLIYAGTSLAQILPQEACTTTDIRETNPKIKNNPELYQHFTRPLNQDSIGWCYAFAAADLMSAEMGTAVSSIHLASMHNLEIQRWYSSKIFKLLMGKSAKPEEAKKLTEFSELYTTGHTDTAIEKAIQQRQVCSESAFPFDRAYPDQLHNMIKDLEILKAHYLEQENVSQEQICSDLSYQSTKHQMLALNSQLVTQNLMTDNMNNLLDKIIQVRCPPSSRLAVPQFKVKTIKPPVKGKPQQQVAVLNRLNRLLDGGQPFSITYQTRDFSIFDVAHVSSITARRWHQGQCQYLVRNSWGEDCISYKAGIECDRARGSFWISDGDLIQKVSKINYLERP